MLLEPKPGITYGPVSSRRLGRSLGINLLPGRRKVCSLDCLYCQYGRTRCFDVAAIEDDLPTPDEVEAAVTESLRTLDRPPQWLTFSGNGEPTLHPDFSAMVDRLLAIRDRLCPEARTAVLSNSTTVHHVDVRAALARLDAAIMKLDCGDEESFRAFNRPTPWVSFGALLEGLRELGDFTVQTLVAGGPEGNASLSQLSGWHARVVALAPRAVQVYTLDRSPAEQTLRQVNGSLLAEMAARLRDAGVAAQAFTRPHG